MRAQLECQLPKLKTNQYDMNVRLSLGTLWLLDSRPQCPRNQLSTIIGTSASDVAARALPMLDIDLVYACATPVRQVTLKAEMSDWMICVLMPPIWDALSWWLRLSKAMSSGSSDSTAQAAAAPDQPAAAPTPTKASTPTKPSALSQLMLRSCLIDKVDLKLRDICILCLELPDEPDAPGSLVLSSSIMMAAEVRSGNHPPIALCTWACACTQLCKARTVMHSAAADDVVSLV